MDPRPASVRVVHTDREMDGPGFHARRRHIADRGIQVIGYRRLREAMQAVAAAREADGARP